MEPYYCEYCQVIQHESQNQNAMLLYGKLGIYIHNLLTLLQNYHKKQKIEQQIFQSIFIIIKENFLFKYATTQFDEMRIINRMPTEDVKPMDENTLKQMIDQLANQYSDVKKRTTTLWSREKGKEVKLDDFTFLKVIMKNQFCPVLLVEEKSKGEWFAMKFIKKYIKSGQDDIEHKKTEKMILKHVNHPYLVNLVYAFQDPSRLFVVMQLMSGGNLFQHLNVSRRFEEKRAKFYAAQVSLGLGHLHSKNIIYRYLKPKNIYMDGLGNVYISDFGIGRAQKDTYYAISSTLCRYPEYTQPENQFGNGCDQTADWWSLGILTQISIKINTLQRYEMMFGITPFYSKSFATLFKNIKEAELKFPEKPAVSSEAKDFITKCLIRDRRVRLGAKSDLQEIMTHPWFKDIDWTALLNKQLPTPFIPAVSGDAWIDHFNRDFTTTKPMFDEQGKIGSKNKKNKYGNDTFDDF